jgi:hypothetical protein
MASLFRDSFDHYSNIDLKWTAGNGAAIDLSGTLSRTGIGCVVLNNTTGAPSLALPVRSGYTFGVAYLVAGLQGSPIVLGNSGGTLYAIQINGNGSISLIDNQNTLGTSAAGLIVTGVYNYFELQVAGGTGVSPVTVRVNGGVVFSGLAGNINQQISVFSLSIPGGEITALADDIYVNDNTGAANTGFLGPVRIAAITANADGAPLQWTPSTAGPHFSLLNQVPQNGGASSVSSSTVGAVDQYEFPLPPNVTAGAVLTDVQVSLLAEISSAGARSLGVQQGADVGAGQALTTNYHYVLQPYDIDPSTGLPWVASDFPVPFGPVITA